MCGVGVAVGVRGRGSRGGGVLGRSLHAPHPATHTPHTPAAPGLGGEQQHVGGVLGGVELRLREKLSVCVWGGGGACACERERGARGR